MRTKKSLLGGALVTVALFATACTGDPAPGGGDGGGGGGPAGDGNPNHDACLIGTWQVDVDDVAQQVAALMSLEGATIENEGTITLEFGSSASATYANTLTMNFPITDLPMVGTAVYSGTVTIADWTAKDGVFTGGDPTGDFDIELTFSIGGTPMAAPFELPDLGNFGGSVPVAYTCAGDSATLTPPAPAPTWRLTRA